MALRPVQRRQKRYIEVAEQLRALIRHGEFVPGSKLPSERELALRFGVGRSSVREALTALQGMGLIEVRQGSGARVLQPVPTEVVGAWARGEFHSEREMLEARIAIECHNAQLAAQRATKEDLGRLAAILSRMEDEDRLGLLGDETDLQFHLTLAEATHNTVLRQLTSVMTTFISQTLSLTRRKLVQQPRNQQQLLDQHRQIFRAVVSGDGVTAAKVMEAHLAFVERELDRFYTGITQPVVMSLASREEEYPRPIDHL